MIKLFLRLLPAFLISAFAISACEGVAPTNPITSLSEEEQKEYPELPPEYAEMVNPLTKGSNAAEEGRILFEANCASCHGEDARGGGPASAPLDPKPVDLAKNQADLSDGFLYWRIAEGGAVEPFHSSMPAWRGILSEKQIWHIITYLRTLG